MPDLSFSVVLSDYSGGSWSKKANMSTVAIMVAFISLKKIAPDEIRSH